MKNKRAGKTNGIPWTDGDRHRLNELPQETQSVVLAWIKTGIILCKNGLVCSSYFLKHRLHAETGIYVSDNQFKEAMLICGISPKNVCAFHWEYPLSRKSRILKNPIDDFGGDKNAGTD